MNKHDANESAFTNGYELGQKIIQGEYAEQFMKGLQKAQEENGIGNIGVVQLEKRVGNLESATNDIKDTLLNTLKSLNLLINQVSILKDKINEQS